MNRAPVCLDRHPVGTPNGGATDAPSTNPDDANVFTVPRGTHTIRRDPDAGSTGRLIPLGS